MDIERDLILIRNENNVPKMQYIVNDVDNIEKPGDIPFLYGEKELNISEK